MGLEGLNLGMNKERLGMNPLGKGLKMSESLGIYSWQPIIIIFPIGYRKEASYNPLFFVEFQW